MAKEDYTTYTESDVPGKFTVNANSIGFAALARNDDSKVVNDFGAGFFGDIGPLGINFDGIVSSSSLASSVLAFHLSELDTFATVADHKWLSVYFNRAPGGARELVLQGHNDIGPSDDNDMLAFTDTTQYYFTLTRASTTTTVEVYSDAIRATLIDTLVITVTGVPSQYLYAIAAFQAGGGPGSISGTIANLELLDVVAATGAQGSYFVELQGLVW